MAVLNTQAIQHILVCAESIWIEYDFSHCRIYIILAIIKWAFIALPKSFEYVCATKTLNVVNGQWVNSPIALNIFKIHIGIMCSAAIILSVGRGNSYGVLLTVFTIINLIMFHKMFKLLPEKYLCSTYMNWIKYVSMRHLFSKVKA